jgi:hypothetical protein
MDSILVEHMRDYMSSKSTEELVGRYLRNEVKQFHLNCQRERHSQ